MHANEKKALRQMTKEIKRLLMHGYTFTGNCGDHVKAELEGEAGIFQFSVFPHMGEMKNGAYCACWMKTEENGLWPRISNWRFTGWRESKKGRLYRGKSERLY